MSERAIEMDELGKGGLHPGLLEATLGLSWTCPLASPIMLKSVITFWAAASPPWATLPPSWSHANANYAMSSLSSSFFYFGSRATRSRFDGKRAIAQRLPEDLRPISLSSRTLRSRIFSATTKLFPAIFERHITVTQF